MPKVEWGREGGGGRKGEVQCLEIVQTYYHCAMMWFYALFQNRISATELWYRSDEVTVSLVRNIKTPHIHSYDEVTGIHASDDWGMGTIAWYSNILNIIDIGQ